jgi:hypothetical protein
VLHLVYLTPFLAFPVFILPVVILFLLLLAGVAGALILGALRYHTRDREQEATALLYEAERQRKRREASDPHLDKG